MWLAKGMRQRHKGYACKPIPRSLAEAWFQPRGIASATMRPPFL